LGLPRSIWVYYGDAFDAAIAWLGVQAVLAMS
jgi:hypothetical protein